MREPQQNRTKPFSQEQFRDARLGSRQGSLTRG